MENGKQPINPIPHDVDCFRFECLGLTKREHIATLAMQGLLTRLPVNTIRTELGIEEVKRIAEEAVIAADTLLAKLEEDYQ